MTHSTTGTRSGLTKLLALTILAIGAAAAPATAEDGEFPDSWYYYGAKRPRYFRAMEGHPAPPLSLGQWHGEEVDITGKVAVVDFWYTGCPPCRKSIPKNNLIHKKYRDKGLVFLSVHRKDRSLPRLPEFLKKYSVAYPVAVDDKNVTVRAWKIRFFPTYAVIDEKGIVRAIGLDPRFVEKTVRKVMGLPKEPVVDSTAWTEPSEEPDRYHRILALAHAPDLGSLDFVHGERVKLDELRGKVVLLNFFRPDTFASVTRLKVDIGMHNKYADHGLVILAIARSEDSKSMAKLVRDIGVPYRVAEDTDRTASHTYRVSESPDYFLIDRSGRLRYADLRDDRVESAVRSLLAEPPLAAAPTPKSQQAKSPVELQPDT